MAGFEIERLREALGAWAEAGRLSSEVIDSISADGLCAPLECEVLDYKELYLSDKASIASIVSDIAAMFNTYGGYLIFGVREAESDVKFEIRGLSDQSINVEQLRDLCVNYTGFRIAVTLDYYEVKDPQGHPRTVAILHAPKRRDADPLHFIKDGPSKANGKQIFLAEDIYFRRGDETLKASGKFFKFLFGPRVSPYGKAAANPLFASAERKVLENSLPDRAFICPDFVGRKVELDLLWEWLADELSHVRILAGEGGLGKTSIAFQFAEELCSEPGSGLEQVIWFTAKQRQFVAFRNEYVSVPETHFTTFDGLLREMCRALARTDEEISTASEKGLKRLIKDGAATIPSLFLIDDIDSLVPAEQKQALELGFLFNGTRTRLLATTRINQSYSNDIAIQVSGFTKGEYKSFVESVAKRYSLPVLIASEIDRMYEITNGSPMYSESLYRLIRFAKPADAFRQWKSEQGELARAAALERELEQLSPEAKRVLLAAAYLQESSVAELCHVTGYVSTAIADKLDELRALHLIAAPQVTSEARFGMSWTTETFVLGRARALSTDNERIRQRVVQLRQEAKRVKTVHMSRMVGAAIDQAIGQLKRKEFEPAVTTVRAAMAQNPNHPDLQCILARCLLRLDPPQLDEARKQARKAFGGGLRKEILFEVWYEAEERSGDNVGAAEAVAAAIEAGAAPMGIWKERRASACWEIARAQVASGNYERAIEEYWLADSEILDLMRNVPPTEARMFRDFSERIHDEIWKIATNISGTSLAIASAGLDVLQRMNASGDARYIVFARVVEVLSWICAEFERDSWPLSKAQRNLADQRMFEANQLLQKGCSYSNGQIRETMLPLHRSFLQKLQKLQGVLDRRGLVV